MSHSHASNPSRFADLPARDVHDRLMTALAELRRAEQNAVMWFAEVLRRKLYRQLGYPSIQQYATDALGFSSGKTSQFIRLSESLRSLPKLERAVARGEVSWTKARELAAVATRSSEGTWIEVARTSSRRDLERRIARSKAATRSARRRDPAQRSIGATSGARSGAGSGARSGSVDPLGSGVDASASDGPTIDVDAPAAAATVQLRFSAEQLARFEALVEAARKRGQRLSREELVLGGLEVLVSDGSSAASDGIASSDGQRDTSETAAAHAEGDRPRVHRSPYQVVVYQCETCGKGHVPTSRGDRPLDLATLRAIVCDSEAIGRGKRLRATTYPGKRRPSWSATGTGARRPAAGAPDSSRCITWCRSSSAAPTT